MLVTHFKEEHWIVNACLISTCELSLWKVLSAANFREEVIGPRDCQGRTLHQARLASGYKTYKDDPMFFLEMSDEQVREIDPGNDLYPFMVAASGETCDLSAVYSLLRRTPSLAHRSKPKRRRKRKRK